MPNFLLLAAASFSVALIWPEKDAAAWVQAIGSIAAIVGAAWFPYLHEARKTAVADRAFEDRIGAVGLHLLLNVNQITAFLGPSSPVPVYDHHEVKNAVGVLRKDLGALPLEERGRVTIDDLVKLQNAAVHAHEFAEKISNAIDRRGAVNLFDKNPEFPSEYLKFRKTERKLGAIVSRFCP